MNYLDILAHSIADECGATIEGEIPLEDLLLYRIYALLCLAKGTRTTSEDVHDAWAVWCAEEDPEHHSLVPFDELRFETQLLDDPYRDAIRAVARELNL